MNVACQWLVSPEIFVGARADASGLRHAPTNLRGLGVDICIWPKRVSDVFSVVPELTLRAFVTPRLMSGALVWD